MPETTATARWTSRYHKSGKGDLRTCFACSQRVVMATIIIPSYSRVAGRVWSQLDARLLEWAMYEDLSLTSGSVSSLRFVACP